MTLSIRPNKQCMRGLHWEFLTDPALDTRAVVESLEAALGERVRRVVEMWMDREVIRLFVPFEVEYRVGERDGQVSLLHRISAKPEIRERSHRELERVLKDLLGASQGRSELA